MSGTPKTQTPFETRNGKHRISVDLDDFESLALESLRKQSGLRTWAETIRSLLRNAQKCSHVEKRIPDGKCASCGESHRRSFNGQ